MYCYLSVFYEIFVESDSDKYAKLNIEAVKELRRQDADEVDIMRADNIQFKERICDLAITIIGIDMKNKKIIDLDYGMLTDKYHKESMREKKKITDRFGRMEPDERKVEYQVKSLKLGKWYLGEEKGIYEYNPELFDAEADDIAAEAALDVAVDATDLDTMVMRQAQAEEDAEMNNMDFGEDYYDGNYYEEDRDEDRD
jgi:hypothetical protein